MNIKAFSLVEILTVIVIVSVLAAVAIPNYITYVLETRTQALFAAATAAKLEVEGRYLREGTAMSAIDVNSGTQDYTTPTADYIKCITIQNGIVSVVGENSEFNNQTIWVSWTPTVSSGLISWACNYSSTAASYVGAYAPNCSTGTAAYSADSACN